MNKKSQVWSIDFIAGLLIFVSVMVISINLISSMENPGNYEALYRDAVHLSDALITDGSPSDWSNNINSTVIPGLMVANSTNRLDLVKLAALDKLDNNISYARTKTLFHITGDYMFFFKNSTSSIKILQCIHGYKLTYNPVTCVPSLDSTKYDDLIKIDRILIYNSTLVTMEIYVWQ